MEEQQPPVSSEEEASPETERMPSVAETSPEAPLSPAQDTLPSGEVKPESSGSEAERPVTPRREKRHYSGPPPPFVIIARQIKEYDQIPRRQIKYLIQIHGLELIQSLANEAIEIEAQGGMMTRNSERRRTLGGIFFHLVNQRIPRTKQKFDKDGNPVEKQPPHPIVPRFMPDDLKEIFESLLSEKGEVTTVKVTLIGRPGQIETRKDLIITVMAHTAKNPTLPKGVPPLPSTATLYTVYISQKQWQRVQESIADPEDALIIEGQCAFDPTINGISVYATNITTKLMEAKKREAKRGAAPEEDAGEQPQPVAAAKPKAAAPAKKAPAKSSFPEATAAAPAPILTPTEVAVPPGMPPAEAQKLSELYSSASLFRQKIAAIQSKPPEQQAGLEMTQKLLKNVEDQITAIEKKYAS